PHHTPQDGSRISSTSHSSPACPVPPAAGSAAGRPGAACPGVGLGGASGGRTGTGSPSLGGTGGGAAPVGRAEPASPQATTSKAAAATAAPTRTLRVRTSVRRSSTIVGPLPARHGRALRAHPKQLPQAPTRSPKVANPGAPRQ